VFAGVAGTARRRVIGRTILNTASSSHRLIAAGSILLVYFVVALFIFFRTSGAGKAIADIWPYLLLIFGTIAAIGALATAAAGVLLRIGAAEEDAAADRARHEGEPPAVS